jgi:hypothetical protein
VTEHGDAIRFLGTVSVSEGVASAEQAQVWDDLEALLSIAVLRIGKTKARARFRLADVPAGGDFQSSATPHSPITPPTEQRWLLVLQSPALVVDPLELAAHWATGHDASTDLYAQYFVAASDQSLSLVHRFTNEELRGGFLSRRSDKENYQPFLTTEAGSVFVLQADGANQAKAQSVVERWLRRGLPLPDWAKQWHGESYQRNPFLPEDGFGEIAVNLPAQLRLQCPVDQVQLLCPQPQ